MSILIINGSPRPKGNTGCAVDLMNIGFEKNLPNQKVNTLRVYSHNISACIHCLSCRKNGGVCVLPDDSAELVALANKADTLIFASPVYWWGLTAQIKLFIDKLFSNGPALAEMDKKIGLYICGEADLDDVQYRIIKEQFDCICDYLKWDFRFYVKACTPEMNSLAEDEDKCNEISSIWKKLL